MAEGCQREIGRAREMKGGEERKRKKEGLSRIESELDLRTARHQDIRDFDRAARSTTAQSLFVSYPLPFLSLPVSPTSLSPFLRRLSSTSLFLSFPFVPATTASRFFASIAPASLLRSPLSALRASVHLDPSSPGGPRRPHHPAASTTRARLRRLLPFAPPLSRPDLLGPLGFTWRALMTSRNERVPPPSNKRLFHVPMLIPRESRRF